MGIRDLVEGENRIGNGDFSVYSDFEGIGSGGSGAVYSVKGPDGVRYAMKIPKDVVLDNDVTFGGYKDEGLLGKYRHEAYIWAILSEEVPDSVVCLVDYGTDPFPWMVMELADGDMNSAIKDGSANVDDVVGLLCSLDSIHKQGVNHLDIKPENVLRVKGRWKLTDFGLSHTIGSMSKSGSDYKGTPDFMAPEQISRKRFGEKDSRTDVWQMGILAYWVIARHSPYDTDDFFERSSMITGDGPDLDAIPSRYHDVLAKAFSINKDERYQSA